MSGSIPDGLMARFSDFIAAKMGLHFPPPRWGDLERVARGSHAEMGYPDPESFIRGLISSPLTRPRMETLASRLTIGETYFWREPQVFEALEGKIIPELALIRAPEGKRLRIWCVGCSTGEEAYSVALALRRAIPAIGEWKVTILATDINTRALKQAKLGQYGEWSFRNAPPWLLEGCLISRKDGKREVPPELRDMIAFEYLNLAEDVYPSSLNGTSAMDIVLCRNVLMYFSSSLAIRIVAGLGSALVEGGYLIVSACECSPTLFSEFETMQFPGATAYKKHREASRSAKTPQRAPEPPIREAPKRAPPTNPAKARPLVAADPPASVSLGSKIKELADRGLLAEALASCEAAIAADRLDPRLQYLRASVLQELNRPNEAIESLKRSIYLDPDSVTAHFTLGNLAFRSGDARTGKRCFRNASALLALRRDDEILADSEGLTVGRFREIIEATMRIDREAV